MDILSYSPKFIHKNTTADVNHKTKFLPKIHNFL